MGDRLAGRRVSIFWDFLRGRQTNSRFISVPSFTPLKTSRKKSHNLKVVSEKSPLGPSNLKLTYLNQWAIRMHGSELPRSRQNGYKSYGVTERRPHATATDSPATSNINHPTHIPHHSDSYGFSPVSVRLPRYS